MGAERAAPLTQLIPICLMVFLEFLAMGLPLPILPARVHGELGFGSFFVGLAVGAGWLAGLATRHAAGTFADGKGQRRAVLVGLTISASAGLVYVASTALPGAASLVILLLGRALLGLGESLVITGALSWGVALVGPQRSGRVMAWVGIAIYGALAAGAPLGAVIASSHGFAGVALAAACTPVAAMGPALISISVPAAAGATRIPFYRVVRLVGLPGAGLSMCGLAFGAIAAYTPLLFSARGWAHAPFALTAFGAAYIGARLFFGGLPDRLGGAPVAAVSAAVAAVGQIAMWQASSGAMAVVAAAATGFGFSLVFPAFGVEAIRNVPPQNRGVALGAYVACFDLTMGFGVPLLGLLIGPLGDASPYAAGALACGGSFFTAIALARAAKRPAS